MRAYSTAPAWRAQSLPAPQDRHRARRAHPSELGPSRSRSAVAACSLADRGDARRGALRLLVMRLTSPPRIRVRRVVESGVYRPLQRDADDEGADERDEQGNDPTGDERRRTFRRRHGRYLSLDGLQSRAPTDVAECGVSGSLADGARPVVRSGVHRSSSHGELRLRRGVDLQPPREAVLRDRASGSVQRMSIPVCTRTAGSARRHPRAHPR